MAEDLRSAAEALFEQAEDWQRLNRNREAETEKKIARLRALRQLREDAEQLAHSRGLDLDELLREGLAELDPAFDAYAKP